MDQLAAASTSIGEAIQPSLLTDKCAGKVITPDRQINFTFLLQEGFKIEELMKGMSWRLLCNLDAPCYLALIKEFYNTLAIGENGLYALVRKVTIRIIADILGHVLQMSTTGLINIDLESKEDTARMIIGDHAIYVNGELFANQLTAEMWLLHSFVTHILFFNMRRFNFISDRDLGNMKYILELESINMPRLMMNYMWEAATKR